MWLSRCLRLTLKSSCKSLISGQADAATAKRAHDDAKVQLAAAQTAAGRPPARPRSGRGRPARTKYETPVASAFASPELAAQLAQDGVTMLDICDWIVDKEPGFHDEWENGRAFRKGVSNVLNTRPEYVFGRARANAAALWRRAPVAGMDLEAPPPAVQAPQPMDVEALAPSPVAQAQPPASPGVVAPRAPDDVAWGFDTPVWSVEAKFTSNPKQRILIGHYLEDEPNLTLLDRMGEVHGLVVVAETADEKFALVCATPKIASGIRSGKFWAAMQGEDCFFVTVKSDARRLT